MVNPFDPDVRKQRAGFQTSCQHLLSGHLHSPFPSCFGLPVGISFYQELECCMAHLQ